MEVLYKLERTIPFTSSLILEANWRSMWLVRKSTDWPEPSRWHNSFQELSWSPLESTCAVVPFLLPRNELCHRRSGQSWPSSRSLTRIWRVHACYNSSRTVLVAHVCRLPIWQRLHGNAMQLWRRWTAHEKETAPISLQKQTWTVAM